MFGQNWNKNPFTFVLVDGEVEGGDGVPAAVAVQVVAVHVEAGVEHQGELGKKEMGKEIITILGFFSR